MALCPGLPGWAGTRKVRPIWILLKQETVSGSGISWTICKSAHRSRQLTTPAPHHSVFYRPDALPAAQPTASKHWRQFTVQYCTQHSTNQPTNQSGLTFLVPAHPGNPGQRAIKRARVRVCVYILDCDCYNWCMRLINTRAPLIYFWAHPSIYFLVFSVLTLF